MGDLARIDHLVYATPDLQAGVDRIEARLGVRATPGATLIGLRGEHPDPGPIRAILRTLGVEIDVSHGRAPALIATIDGRRGRIDLTD